VFGKHQAGIPEFHFANLIEDAKWLKMAMTDAKTVIGCDDLLSKKLKNEVIKSIDSYHLD